jgi:hypothetical protein
MYAPFAPALTTGHVVPPEKVNERTFLGADVEMKRSRTRAQAKQSFNKVNLKKHFAN